MSTIAATDAGRKPPVLQGIPDHPVPERSLVGSQAVARMATFEFIEGWYNPHRRHSALDYESPINYERRLLAAA